MIGATRAVLVVVMAVATVAGCTSDDGDGASAGQVVTATLEIISTNIESALDGKAFAPAKEGAELEVGDQVKTDRTGFAELTYHDGSWQRIENNATLTLEGLTAEGDINEVETSVDVGRTWNRVSELTEPDDAYEVETPVATASVRGTVFTTDCADAEHCTFMVLEGTVVITRPGGDPITMDAPSRLEVVAGETPGEPQLVSPDELRNDPWVAKNLEEDAKQLPADGDEEEESSSGNGPSTSEFRTATMDGGYDAVRTGVATNYQPNSPNHVALGPEDRAYTMATNCDGGTCGLQLIVDGAGESSALATFDGTSYTATQELVADCTGDDGTNVAGAATVTVDTTWTPTEVERVGGQWVVTEFTGTVTHTGTVAKPAEFAAQGCVWDTTDGQPVHQEVTVEATRR